jgi:MFS family permease
MLFCAGAVNFLDRSSLSIANTLVRADLHLNGTEMGWLLSAFSLAYGFAQLPLIDLLDNVGTRSLLGGGLLVWSSAQLLTGYVGGFAPFLLLRILLGAGEAPFYPAGIRSLRDWFTVASRGRATAVMNSSQTFALAIAPPALTFIMLRLGWRSMFVLLGAMGLVIACAWLLLHRERKDTIWRDTEAPPRISESAIKVLLSHRTVWGMMLGWGGINYTAWLYLAWLPGYLQEQHHLSISQSGWLTSLPFSAGALGMYLSGFVADRLAISGVPLAKIHRFNLVLGMSVSAACTLLVAICHSTLEAVAGISLALFAIHYAGTSGWGYVQTIAPLRLVVSLGALQNFAGFLIASAAPVVTGWLLDRSHSFGMALGLCSAVTLLGALSYATLAEPDGLDFSEAHAT